jgi:hypothetical protein
MRFRCVGIRVSDEGCQPSDVSHFAVVSDVQLSTVQIWTLLKMIGFLNEGGKVFVVDSRDAEIELVVAEKRVQTKLTMKWQDALMSLPRLPSTAPEELRQA